MREILFRGKRIDSGEWVNGSFCMDATEQLYGCNGADGFIRRYITEKREMNMFEVERETVGQFTGLTDCNGVKIFEGDVIEYTDGCNDWLGAVKYDGDDAQFVVRFIGGDVESFDNLYSGDCEVIGNIYDNPELLEVSKSD